MRARQIEATLRQIYRRHEDLSATHQAELEARLTECFTSGPRRGPVAYWKRRTARRIVMTAMVCGTALAGSQLPAQYSVKVGEQLTISVRAGDPLPQPDVLMPMLQQAGSTVARVHTRQRADGAVMVAEIWGNTLAGDLPDQVRAVFPSAHVAVRSMQGNLRGTVLDKLRYELLDLAGPRQVAQARAALLKELAARGENATVDISAGDLAGRRQPRILVRVHGQNVE